MERTASVREKYSEEHEQFLLVATCPYPKCKKQNEMLNGQMQTTCNHFVREGHGCGGTVFVFSEKRT